jgi:hypothetical protein
MMHLWAAPDRQPLCGLTEKAEDPDRRLGSPRRCRDRRRHASLKTTGKIPIPQACSRTAYVRDLIAQRAPEIESSEIAEAFALPLDDDTGIPPRVAEQILLVLDRMADRMDGFENRLRPN